MSGNGKGILSLHGRPLGKGGDFITRDQCKEMITTECAKVHEHYLNQIPKFTAQMIQDALVGYGLLVIQPDTDAPAVSENAEGDTGARDSTAPVGAPCGDEPSAEPAA